MTIKYERATGKIGSTAVCFTCIPEYTDRIIALHIPQKLTQEKAYKAAMDHEFITEGKHYIIVYNYEPR